MSHYFITVNRKDIFLVDETNYKTVGKQIEKKEDLNFTALKPDDMTLMKLEYIRWPSILNISIEPAYTNDASVRKQ